MAYEKNVNEEAVGVVMHNYSYRFFIHSNIGLLLLMWQHTLNHTLDRLHNDVPLFRITF